MHRDRRRRATWAIVGVIAGPPERSPGSVPGSVEVQWNAPAGCPGAAQARQTVQARVGDAVGGRRIRARVDVQSRNDTWWVAIDLDSDEGPIGARSLSAPTCEDALTATAVVIAIAVDPSAASSSPSPTPIPGESGSTPGLVPEPIPSDRAVPAPGSEPDPRTVERESSTDPTRTENLDSPDPRSLASRADDGAPHRSASHASPPAELGLSLGVRGGIEIGPLASTAAAHIAGVAGLWGPRWHTYAGALHRTRVEVDAALPQDAGGRFRVTAGQAGVGPRLAWGSFELPLSAGLELGALWARGVGAVEPITVRRLWLAVAARAGVGWQLTNALALQLGIDGVVPLLRPPFTLGDGVEVLTVGPFAFRAWLGIDVRFPL